MEEYRIQVLCIHRDQPLMRQEVDMRGAFKAFKVFHRLVAVLLALVKAEERSEEGGA